MGSMISYLACILISLAAGIAVAFPLGIQYRKKVAEAELGTARKKQNASSATPSRTLRSRKKRRWWRQRTRSTSSATR